MYQRRKAWPETKQQRGTAFAKTACKGIVQNLSIKDQERKMQGRFIQKEAYANKRTLLKTLLCEANRE